MRPCASSAAALTTTGGTAGGACGYARSTGGELSSFFVLPIHRHALAWKDMSQGALMAELAVSLYKPCADFLLLTWFEDAVGEWTSRASSARANFEKFARDMGEILAYTSN